MEQPAAEHTLEILPIVGQKQFTAAGAGDSRGPGVESSAFSTASTAVEKFPFRIRDFAVREPQASTLVFEGLKSSRNSTNTANAPNAGTRQTLAQSCRTHSPAAAAASVQLAFR